MVRCITKPLMLEIVKEARNDNNYNKKTIQQVSTLIPTASGVLRTKLMAIFLVKFKEAYFPQVINRSSPELQCLEGVNMNDIVYGPIHPEKYNDVIKHLRNNFFADEPLNKSLSLCKAGQPHEELEEFSLNVISQGASFMGVLSTTGEVVGVLLNGYEAEDENPSYKKCYNDQKLQKIFDFLGSVDKDVDFLTHYNARNIFELKILSVDMKFRGRGIAGRLYEITEKFAQSKGFSLLRTDATALFSQKLFQKFGFETLKEIVYEEYPSKEAPLFNVEPPHVSFKLMVKKIEN